MTPEDFIKLPSRLSAEAMNREERQRLLDEVTRNNFIANSNKIEFNIHITIICRRSK